MRQTPKKPRQSGNTILEIIRRENGTFDLFLNGRLDRENIPLEWLNEELCVRFGFCGKEYDLIIDELTRNGGKRLVF